MYYSSPIAGFVLMIAEGGVSLHHLCLVAAEGIGCSRNWLLSADSLKKEIYIALLWKLLLADLPENEQVSAQTFFCFRNDNQLVGSEDISGKPLQKWSSAEFPGRDKQGSIGQRRAACCRALPANKGKVMWTSHFCGELLWGIPVNASIIFCENDLMTNLFTLLD